MNVQYLDQMAAKLGVAAEHVYGLLVRQQITEGVACITGAVIYCIVFVKLIRWLHGKYEKSRDDYQSEWWAATALIGLFGGIATVVSIWVFFVGVQHLINPEYYVIREIMDTIR